MAMKVTRPAPLSLYGRPVHDLWGDDATADLTLAVPDELGKDGVGMAHLRVHAQVGHPTRIMLCNHPG